METSKGMTSCRDQDRKRHFEGVCHVYSCLQSVNQERSVLIEDGIVICNTALNSVYPHQQHSILGDILSPLLTNDTL